MANRGSHRHMDSELRDEREFTDVRMQTADPAVALRSEALEDEFWKEPVNLVAPPSRPGYTQRWVRVAIQSVDDVSNLAKAYQQGWRPRTKDTIDELQKVPTIKHGEYAGVVGVHGMILMERPNELDEKHRAFIKRRTDHQARAITGELEAMEHKDMPLSIEMRAKVQRGGRRPRIAPDSNPNETP